MTARSPELAGRMISNSILILVCGAAFLVSAPATADELTKCVVALNLPVLGIPARWADSGGDVQTDVLIGKDGKVAKMTTIAPELQLRIEVETQLVSSEFRPSCAGRTLRLIFTFQFEGEPTHERRPPKVLFQPPNRFTIKLRKGAPEID